MKSLLMVLGCFFGFFAFLAVAVPRVTAAGYGTDGLFFVVIGAILLATLIPLLLSLAWKRLARSFDLVGKSRGELARLAIGFDTSALLFESVVDVPRLPTARPSQVEDHDDESEMEEEVYVCDDEDMIEETGDLHEDGGLCIAETFEPAPGSFCGQVVSIAGIRRSGKSNLMRVLIEELGACEFPLLVNDTEDEYQAVARRAYLPYGCAAGHPSCQADAVEGVRYLSLTTKNAYRFGQELMVNGLQVVVNLKSYPDNESAFVMAELLRGIEDWQQARKSRVPMFVFLSEAIKWFPQNARPDLSKEAQAALQTAFFDTVVRRGGKRGFGLVVDFQKVSEVDKRLLQGQWKFVFCQSEQPDLERCAKMGLDEGEVRALQQGECFVFCPQVPAGMFMQARLGKSPHVGSTPGMQNLAAHRRSIPRSLTGILNQLHLEESETKQDRAIPVLAPQTEPLPSTEGVTWTPVVVPARRQASLEQAIEAWKNGATGARKLERALKIPYNQARDLVQKMTEQGLITVD